MGRCLVGGLIADGYPAQRLRVSDPSEQQLELLKQRFPVSTGTDNLRAIEGADVVVLAVKPQLMRTVAMEIALVLSAAKPLVISVAAGIRTAALAHWLGPDIPIVRAMPNTPALFGSGATALFAMTNVNADQRETAESILRAVGLTVWVEEEAAMDAVTALSGSGPAYYFLLMELMENAAAAMGMPRETARLLTLQTAFGAAKMALESGLDAATLRKQVTSPGGTTEQALRVFESQRFGRIVEEALSAAKLRSEELAKTFGE